MTEGRLMHIIFPDKVIIQEISPRAALQRLPHFIQTAKKLEFIGMLEKAGCHRIEASAFESQRYGAQLSDSAVIAASCGAEGVGYSYLVQDRRAMARALASGARELVFSLSASEVHNMSHAGKSIADSLEELVLTAKESTAQGIKLRVNLAAAFGYEGEVPINKGKVERICLALAEAGYTGITLGDSNGLAEPEVVYELCSTISALCPETIIGLHLHQAHGREYACILAGLRAGITTFDAAVGRIGGYPYTVGAGINIATEILCLFFEQLGIHTQIDLKLINECAAFAKELELLGT